MDLSFLAELEFRVAFLAVFTVIMGMIIGAKTAFESANENKLEKLLNKGKKSAEKVLKLKNGNLTSILDNLNFGEKFASTVFITTCTIALFKKLVLRLVYATNFSIKYLYIIIISMIILFVTLTFGYVVFVQFIPRKLALQNPEKTACALNWVNVFICKISKPFYSICHGFSNLVIKILGLDPNVDIERITEEEIRQLVVAGEEKGVIEDTQREMINNIFEFDDITAGDIMTHRTDIEAVEITEPIQEVVNVAIEAGCSRIPVYEEDLDNIIGVIYVKDLLKFIGEKLTKSETIKQLVRTALFVPETMPCGKLFTQMTEKRIQMAIVVDEYGGTAGLVTMEDLLESIVGNIQDEYDDENDDFSKIDEKTYTFDGVTDIEEFEDIVGVSLPEGDYDTLAGFVINLLGYLPTDETESVAVFENMTFTVLGVEERRIEQIKVEFDKEDIQQ